MPASQNSKWSVLESEGKQSREFGQMRILIIDPNATFRESFRRFLQPYFPLTIIRESDEESARQAAWSFLPDMVVMDMDLELVRTLKLENPGIILILMVPDDLPEYLDAARRSGADHVFSKRCVTYFEINRLLKIISRTESDINGYIRTYP